MKISRSKLSEYQFTHTHDLVLNDDSAKFVSKTTEFNQSSSIYLWLSPCSETQDDFLVLYVGKAGYGINRRFNQHTGGFRNSSTGKSNLKLIVEHILAGNQIQVYAKNASTISLFGSKTSLYSTEEEAMCKAYEPLWNRANFPSISIKNKTVESTIEQSESKPAPSDIEIDFSQYAVADDIHAFYLSLCQEAKTNFIQLLSLISNIPTFAAMPQKIVGGYSDQPSGYNGVPMLVFSPLGVVGRAVADAWGVRIPLIDEKNKPLTVIFHDKYINPNLDENLISKGKAHNFRPKDLEDFMGDLNKYLTNI
jgi:hypothetical protein